MRSYYTNIQKAIIKIIIHGEKYMTVWAKLQSWIGAAASGTNLDNEFNNIYTGLNESQNGSRPSGYNDVRLTYSTDQLTVKGETKANGVNVDLNSTITVSGATGWRYVVTTTGGVVSVETIPGAEITANTTVYSPTPVFNNTLNGYYSTVNTTRRIIGVLWYDSTTKILEVIAYKNGANKNDDYIRNDAAGSDIINTINQRLQLTSAMRYLRGNRIDFVDNGTGSTDAFGARITNLDNSPITISASVNTYSVSTPATAVVGIHKNGVLFIPAIVSCALVGSNESMNSNFTFTDKNSQSGDYYTFKAIDVTNMGIILVNLEATK